MINKIVNPFEYDAASNLSPEQVLEFYIEDFNYSRFIESHRNVFLIGERGSGKTMTLLYNTYRFKEEEYSKYIGIYIPCKTPLFYKKEHELIQDNKFKAAVLSEHFFVLAIAYHIVDTLSSHKIEIAEELNNNLISDFEYILGKELLKNRSFFESFKSYIDKENFNSQTALNKPDDKHFYEESHSFFSLIIPLLNFLKRIPSLENCHFNLMIDDAHDLNQYQTKALNSWIAYRDHSYFSLKVATAKVKRPQLVTSTGGSILEGHDFLSIDMEEPFQNKFSDFGKLSRQIVNRRLKKVGLDITADEFFPINPKMSEDLEVSEKIVRKKAEAKFQDAKKISDWIYKYKRSEYFKERSTKANLPPYSGFDTIVHLSTGVIRNLLYPCYWMYDKAISESSNKEIKFIEPKIQTEVIKEKSEEVWKRLETELYNIVDDCSTKEAEQIRNLFVNLALLFRKRLLSEISEPRAIAFSISSYSDDLREKIDPLLRIAQESQILYTRIGPTKSGGKREVYYVPNRMLWPIYGLDPVGQHARVSLRASDIWNAAHGIEFPFNKESKSIIENDLFSNL